MLGGINTGSLTGEGACGVDGKLGNNLAFVDRWLDHLEDSLAVLFEVLPYFSDLTC